MYIFVPTHIYICVKPNRSKPIKPINEKVIKKTKQAKMAAKRERRKIRKVDKMNIETNTVAWRGKGIGGIQEE